MIKSMRWALPALSLLAACASASPPQAKVAPAKPGLWKVADADTTIYLFGTIHVLPKNYKWRTAKFDKAERSARELVLEVADLDDVSKTVASFQKLAISPNLPPVVERVPEAKRAGLEALIAKTGLPAEALTQYESWAVAITLAAGMLKDLDVSPDYGVEKQLQADFKAAKKPVHGLETSEQQFGFFDSLPEAAQRNFLSSMVDDSLDPAKELKAMLSSWSSGNDKAIAVNFDDEFRSSPELVETLLRKRNANWTLWIKERLDKPGTVLVAVGAGHLAGADSVIAMLGKQGLKVTRIQ